MIDQTYINESQKGASFDALAACETLVFKPGHVCRTFKKRRFLALSSMFAHPGTLGEAKSFHENDLTIGPRAQWTYQYSTRTTPLGNARRAAERQSIPERISDRHLAR